MQFDTGQQAFIDEIINGSGHVIATARAGSGKTTALLEGVRQLVSGRKLVLVFNKDVQQEVQARVFAQGYVSDIEIKTLHSFALDTLRLHRGNVQIDKQRGKTMARMVAFNWQRQERAAGRPPETIRVGRCLIHGSDVWKRQPWELYRFVGLCKNMHPTSLADMGEMTDSFGYTTEIIPARVWARLAAVCLQRSVDQFEDTVDFDDLMYLPRKLGLRPLPRDYVICDELQDFSASQLWLARAALRAGTGRMIGVGDPRQGIYTWRGAHKDIMSTLTAELSAKSVELSVTYRCPTSVVKHVQEAITGLEDFRARPDAPVGRVEARSCTDLLGVWGARPGDFVLSRLNAPLVTLAAHYIGRGVPATISGKDIGKSLIDLVRDSKCRYTEQLAAWLTGFREKEVQRLTGNADENEDTEALTQVCDRVDAIIGLCSYYETCAELIQALDDMFSNVPNNDGSREAEKGLLVLSTVHKAKGRERDRVWLLDWTFVGRGATEEGDNIYYVGATRARQDLFLVQEPDESDNGVKLLPRTRSLHIDAGLAGLSRTPEYQYEYPQ